jgi:hypothetical protein
MFFHLLCCAQVVEDAFVDEDGFNGCIAKDDSRGEEAVYYGDDDLDYALLLGDLFELESNRDHTGFPVDGRNPFTHRVEAHPALGRDAGASSLSFKAINGGKPGQRHDEQRKLASVGTSKMPGT